MRLFLFFLTILILQNQTFARASHSTLDLQKQNTVRVLTLNAWLLRVLGYPIGKDISERIKLIPQAIADTGADIVALQEVWSTSNKKFLQKKLDEFGYHYVFYTKRVVGVGNGLMLVSKYPILFTTLSPIFHKRTRPDELVASKRALYAEIKIGNSQAIDFFTLHTGALSYDDDTENYNRIQKAKQRSQYIDFKEWFKKTRRHSVSIVAGDLNADYRTLSGGRFLENYSDDYYELIDHACNSNEDFLNTFLAANNMDETSPEQPTYSKDNPYVSSGAFANAPSETEDYIFSCGIDKEDILNSEILFKEVPSNEPSSKALRISDHYGLLSVFSF